MNRINLLAASLAIFLCVFSANAATFTVTKTADTNDGVCDADCSLREAVETDNNFGATNTILFAPALSGQTIAVTSAQMPLFQDLTITGLGANLLTISCQNGQALFDVVGNNYTFTDMTITGCNSGGLNSGIGGALKFFSSSTVANINRMYFTGNSAFDQAGALYFQGTQLTITNSTFSNNTTPQCGALSVAAGTVNITNSTFSGNTASSLGGALCSAGSAVTTLRNVTISGNSGGNAGGIWKGSSGTLNLGNSVVAGNTAATSFPEIWYSSGTLTSSGNNHIGDSAGDSTSTSLPITWLGTDTVNANPVLGALTLANGGNTSTHLPTAGSPLINTGNNALATGLTMDQRGFPRFVGTVDKGAVEAGGTPTAAEVSIGGRVMGATGRVVYSARVTLTDAQGNVRVSQTGPFGYYNFDGVPAGGNYVLSASARGFNFAPQLLTPQENLTAFDLIAQPEAGQKGRQ